MTTVIQVVDWIMKHRTGKSFNHPYNMIIRELIECAESDSMVVIKGDGDRIAGVVCGKPDKFRKVLFVYDILSIEKGVLKRMIQYFREKFPGYTLEAQRKNGKLIAYKNVARLEKLTNIYGR